MREGGLKRQRKFVLEKGRKRKRQRKCVFVCVTEREGPSHTKRARETHKEREGERDSHRD
jgi:hypothetical protein